MVSCQDLRKKTTTVHAPPTTTTAEASGPQEGRRARGVDTGAGVAEEHPGAVFTLFPSISQGFKMFSMVLSRFFMVFLNVFPLFQAVLGSK